MFDRASMKLGLDKAVLQSMGGEKINPVSFSAQDEYEKACFSYSLLDRLPLVGYYFNSTDSFQNSAATKCGV